MRLHIFADILDVFTTFIEITFNTFATSIFKSTGKTANKKQSSLF